MTLTSYVNKLEKKASKPRAENSPSRCFHFTNYKKLLFEYYEDIYEEYGDLIRYILVAKEVCPKTKRPHIQGFIQMYKCHRFTKVKKIIGGNPNVSRMYSNEFASTKYCKKEGNWKQYGKRVTQGYRSDREQVFKEIRDGAKLDDVILNHPETYSSLRNGIKDYYSVVKKKGHKCFVVLKLKF